MNWLTKIAEKSLIKEIGLWGWAEDQLRQDGVCIYKHDNEIFISLGDWANVKVDDLKGAIKRVYPGSEVDYDFEAGPPEGWERIF